MNEVMADVGRSLDSDGDTRSQGLLRGMKTVERHGQGRSERLTLAIGVTLSTVLGVFFYFKTDLATAMATLAGLIGTTITLQVESIFRERRMTEGITRQQRLIGQVEAVEWLPSLLEQALNAISAIEHGYGGTTAVDLTREAFDDCLAQLNDLQRGRYVTSIDDNKLVFAITERVQRTLRATSADAQDLQDFWLTPTGERYWRLNQGALERGVAIQRVFIYRTWNDQLEALARKQHDTGVSTLRVALDQLPPALRLNLIIWDNTSGFETRANSTGEFIDNIFTFAPQDLTKMLDRYTMIEACAEPWPVPPNPPPTSTT